jgi:hypothetical protein
MSPKVKVLEAHPFRFIAITVYVTVAAEKGTALMFLLIKWVCFMQLATSGGFSES